MSHPPKRNIFYDPATDDDVFPNAAGKKPAAAYLKNPNLHLQIIITKDHVSDLFYFILYILRYIY